MLDRFVRTGTMIVVDADGKKFEFGDKSEPSVTLRFHNKSIARKIFLKPELYAGEAYMDGTLTFDDGGLHELLEIALKNGEALESYPLQKMMLAAARAVKHVQQHNPIKRSAANVAHHYNLSRELYALFLDEDLQYSCAYFRSPNDTLEQAQANKKRHIATKLHIKDGQRILDIGSGWGGLALYIGGLADVEVLGITLSEEQLSVAQERAKEMGLEKRVKFELRDYREIDDEFDRIVSVGMFEHVGVGYYDTFFAKLKNLLTDDGIALLHSIGRISPPSTTTPWTRKYIFPGGYAPALSEVFAAIEHNRLWTSDMEILRLHYAETLRNWNERFQKNRARIAEMYDERFCRMWEFYLISSEMTFRHSTLMVFQMQLAKSKSAAPLVRDYANSLNSSAI